MSDLGDVAMTTVLATLIIVDIIGNFLVIVIIKRNRDMRYVVCSVICKIEFQTAKEPQHVLIKGDPRPASTATAMRMFSYIK